jgi:hypothetical protein
MIQILPVTVPGYLVPFIVKEMDGISVAETSGDYTNISVEPNSILGMFLRRRIKPEYKTKNYQILIYSKKMGGTRAYCVDLKELQMKAEFSVDLTFEELEEFYKFLSHGFMLHFQSFVRGFVVAQKIKNTRSKCRRKHQGVRSAIRFMLDEYDMLEYGFSENQMRRLYYLNLKQGCFANLHKSIQFNKKIIE